MSPVCGRRPGSSVRGVVFPPSTFRRAPLVPRLARSLRHLAREVDATWPNRGSSADGWIGDDAHTRTVSDHNPDPDGIVHALDITLFGDRADAVVQAAVAHPATRYVIHDRQIFSSRNEFMPEPYLGPNPHTNHVHVSIKHTHRAERSRARWLHA